MWCSGGMERVCCGGEQDKKKYFFLVLEGGRDDTCRCVMNEVERLKSTVWLSLYIPQGSMVDRRSLVRFDNLSE